MPATQAYICLGSNAPDAAARMDAALQGLRELPHAELRVVSPRYETEPQDYANQPWFLNQIAALALTDDFWTPEDLLRAYGVTIFVTVVGTLLGALALRTQMVEISFESSQVQTRIERLSQDVEERQTQLDMLKASLPERAQEMGMVPQEGSISIDLNGYQPSEGGTQ